MAILVFGTMVFYLLAKAGGRLLDKLERQEKAAVEQTGDEKMEWGATAGKHARASAGTMEAPNASLPAAI